MSAPPCSPPVTCPGSDNPILNLSSESPDQFVNIGLNWGPVEPPPTNRIYTNNGCLGQCTSTISQEDADICAARQALICVDGGGEDPTDNPTLVCNTPQTAVVMCPDGLPFRYTVPGGLFCGYSQSLVDQTALEYAQRSAQGQAICLGSLQRCCCIDVPYTSTIKAVGASGVNWTIASGSLPPGLSLSPSSTSVTVSGTPTASGTYTFSILALTSRGNFMSKTFVIVVLEIVTTSLPGYTVGTPYSYQLQAAGGSGNYAWKISSGSLPAGLVLDATGLIHGTPL